MPSFTVVALPHCDKCEGLVLPQNNAAVFEFINTFGSVVIYFGTNRHIQPVTGEGSVVVCEGNPSRWKAISQMPDQRPEYQSVEAGDPMAIAVWELMQTLNPGALAIEGPTD